MNSSVHLRARAMFPGVSDAQAHTSRVFGILEKMHSTQASSAVLLLHVVAPKSHSGAYHVTPVHKGPGRNCQAVRQRCPSLPSQCRRLGASLMARITHDLSAKNSEEIEPGSRAKALTSDEALRFLGSKVYWGVTEFIFSPFVPLSVVL